MKMESGENQAMLEQSVGSQGAPEEAEGRGAPARLWPPPPGQLPFSYTPALFHPSAR